MERLAASVDSIYPIGQRLSQKIGGEESDGDSEEGKEAADKALPNAICHGQNYNQQKDQRDPVEGVGLPCFREKRNEDFHTR